MHHGSRVYCGCAAAQNGTLGIDTTSNSIVRSRHHSAILLALLALLVSSCFFSSCPGPRTGPLSMAADSVASDVDRLSCNGPRACWGYAPTGLRFYLAPPSGDIEVVGHEWMLRSIGTTAPADSLVRSLTEKYGPPQTCAGLSTRVGEKAATWKAPDRVFLLKWYLAVPDSSLSISLYQLLPNRDCAVPIEVPFLPSNPRSMPNNSMKLTPHTLKEARAVLRQHAPLVDAGQLMLER